MDDDIRDIAAKWAEAGRYVYIRPVLDDGGTLCWRISVEHRAVGWAEVTVDDYDLDAGIARADVMLTEALKNRPAPEPDQFTIITATERRRLRGAPPGLLRRRR